MPRRKLFRRKYSDLQLRMEALGLESANKDRAKLEQRLLNAVSDLQLMQKEREQYRDQMLRLTEAMLAFAEDVARAAMRRRGWKWKRNCAARTSLIAKADDRRRRRSRR